MAAKLKEFWDDLVGETGPDCPFEPEEKGEEMAEYEEDLSPAQRLDVLWAMCELRVNLVDDIRDRVDAAATGSRARDKGDFEHIDDFREAADGEDSKGAEYWFRSDALGRALQPRPL